MLEGKDLFIIVFTRIISGIPIYIALRGIGMYILHIQRVVFSKKRDFSNGVFYSKKIFQEFFLYILKKTFFSKVF